MSCGSTNNKVKRRTPETASAENATSGAISIYGIVIEVEGARSRMRIEWKSSYGSWALPLLAGFVTRLSSVRSLPGRSRDEV